MKVDPCTVCGGTDLNLVDGFYYCVECGTQDVNARETVVEHTMLADGTIAIAATRKFTTVLKDGIEMRPEWHKWHTFNFILSGLADELVALGAGPDFKMKALWVWTQYIEQFQDKDDVMETSVLLENDNLNTTKTSVIDENQDSNNNTDEETPDTSRLHKKSTDRFIKDIKIVTKGVLLAILYIALNLDNSDIQLSHLMRYIREGRISISDCSKFVPQELNRKSIPHWKSLIRCTRQYNMHSIRTIAMSLFRRLNLGTPLVPDFRKIIDNFTTELCLPKEFSNLVISLINLVPCDYLNISKLRKGLVRIPDFEAVIMSYVLIALKMCFGLDCHYEVKLSDVIDKINTEQNHLKCYKLGMFLEDTDRLFSFREWCNFLQFRKIMLCKYYLPMAHQHNMDVDDHVFMEQLGERSKTKIKLSDEVTQDILNKIPLNENVGVIPNTEFTPTLTPRSTYTEVILQYIQDTELKLLLSEDFTKYSLKYACEELKLPIEDANVVAGVTETNKIINPIITGSLISRKADFKLVYVRNCENKNWLTTKPPTLEHISKIDEDTNGCDKDSDRGYDSNTEHESPVKNDLPSVVTDVSERLQSPAQNDRLASAVTDVSQDQISLVENDLPRSDSAIKQGPLSPDKSNIHTINKTEDSFPDETKDNRKLEIIEEEDLTRNIFDDTFEDVDEDIKKQLDFDNIDINDSNTDMSNLPNDMGNLSEVQFNPETFNREETIRELILMASKKYKIPIPREYNPIKPRKRKSDLVHIGAGPSEPKRSRVTIPGDDRKEIDLIIAAYYSNLENDVLNKVSEQVKDALQGIDRISILDESTNQIDADQSNINFDDSVVPIEESQSNENIENGHEQHESIIEENVVDEFNVEDLIRKSDPKYDKKTHDIKQLYVKFSNEIDTDISFDFDDPELEKILDKKIKESSKKRVEESSDDDECNRSNDDDNNIDESCDGIDEKVSDEEIDLLRMKNLKMKKKLEPLLNNSKSIKHFKYWFRHYTTATMAKNLDMQKKFDLELKENCPVSFNFVLYECAAILNCTAYSLYKLVQNLEQIWISKM